MIEHFFRDITTEGLRRGEFHNVIEALGAGGLDVRAGGVEMGVIGDDLAFTPPQWRTIFFPLPVPGGSE